MLTLIFLIRTLIDLYITLLLLLIWMQIARCDFFNPIAQSIFKVTQPIVGWLRNKIIPNIASIDVAALTIAFILSIIKFPTLRFIENRILTLDSIDLFIGLLVFIKSTGKIIFWVIITRSILSWVNYSYNPIHFVLYQMSEILINPVRKILPDTNVIDFSPMIIIFTLYALNYLGMDLLPNIWYIL
ncbi:hypothetical protein CRV12_03750 (plasmid) [Candidatus Pantoea edessiphila]|uniref:YggT family protein n=1 Tax=Candidatus Pantoea edessiphila TaxID=2044610 RepID=A0A2P5SZ55_9GAMM|nr:YggT family protein [Candidatus Pantoea edessiphila]PPI87619.1 hypothetical protein CRV12_03750 [Candidatus Pantoea edessiphila]